MLRSLRGDNIRDSGSNTSNKIIETFTSDIEEFFNIYEKEILDNGIRYYVNPRDVFSIDDFKKRIAKYLPTLNIEMKYVYGEFVIEAFLRRDEKDNYWINIILFIATVATTTFVGASFSPDFSLLEGMKFSFAIMFVLGSHEMGHYIIAKRWGMKTSLPYFIPFPTIVGTLGAIIRHKGAIPNRKALFDVGVSGPLVGIFASIIITAIGLSLPYKAVEGTYIELGTPLLFDLITYIVKPESEVIHPIAFAGWVGMLVTFFNLIPAGQLDGGHILRAMLGKKADRISRIMPMLVIATGLIYTTLFKQDSILIFWGLVVFIFSMQRHPEPLDDEEEIDMRRYLIGIFTFIIGILCFNPAPIRI